MMITNYLSPLAFEVTIKRLPNVEFFTQRVSIPSISANAALVPNPLNMTFSIPDKISYGTLDMMFIVDETMNNYIEVHDWMVGIAAPQKFSQFGNIKKSKEGLYSDISVLVKNSKKLSNIRFNYKNCFPIQLSEITLDVTQQSVNYIESNVTFQYDYYEIEKVSQ